MKKETKLSEKQLTKEQFMKIEYPYRKFEISRKELLETFNRLKEFQPIILNINPSKIKINTLNLVNNEYVIFLEDYQEYKELYQITDYFSQKCRVRCIFNLKEDKNILDLFQENKTKIYNNLKKNKEKLTFHNINEYIWRHFRQCTNFNTTVVVSVIKLFNAKKMLDFSAGWGDRLIGAIATGIDYTGVDPSNCMNPIYEQIINTLTESKSKYRIIQDGFENVKLKDSIYDLVFTSPPFFDLEIYEDDDTQSIEKFKSVAKWRDGFLFPSIKKSYKCLKVKGHLALYITDYKKTSYVKEMKEFVKKKVKGLKYIGDIHWYDKSNKNTIRKIFVWEKKK